MQATATNEARYSKKICSRTASQGFALLTDDLLFEILSWLPAKCLTRYRSVCKLWCMIIKSRKFIEKHMQHAKPFKYFVTFVLRTSPNPFLFNFTIDGLILERSIIDGHCRIRNHTTNWDLVLPLHDVRRAYASMSYLPSSGKYKVLSLRRSADCTSICLNVLTIGVDVTWRPVEVPISCGNKRVQLLSSTFEGVSYIMKYCYMESSEAEIVAFQTEDERFVKIPVPQRVEVLCSTGSWFRIIELNTKFCIWCMLEGEFHIWVLQDQKKAQWEELKIVLPSSVGEKYPKYRPYKHEGTLVFVRRRLWHSCYDFKSKKTYGTPKCLEG